MLAFLREYWGTILVGLIVLLVVVLCIRSLWKDKKKGGCAGCSGCCGSCPSAGACHQK